MSNSSGFRLAVAVFALAAVFDASAQDSSFATPPECASIEDRTEREACVYRNANAVRPYEDYDKRLRDSEQVSPLTSQLFGDETNLSNGATSFSVADINLPGNNGLAVELRRTFAIESKRGAEPLAGFGSWDLDVPYLVGTFESGNGWSPNRCSQMYIHPSVGGNDGSNFWSGTMFHLPGQGDQELLWLPPSLAHPKPSTGGPFNWTARGDVRFSCTTVDTAESASGITGEAFVAHLPDGTKYTLNVGISVDGGSMRLNGELFGRKRIYLMPSRIIDRFGNGVTYRWTGGRLDEIEADDGRKIVVIRNGENQITSATAHGRTWTYGYNGRLGEFGANGVAWLQSVSFVDQNIVPSVTSTWTYTRTTGTLVPFYPTPDVHEELGCPWPPIAAGSQNGANFTLTAAHPSGAKGIFDFVYTRHHRSGVSQLNCGTSGPGYRMNVPEYADVYSLVQKKIGGFDLEGNKQAITPWETYVYQYSGEEYSRTNLDTSAVCTTCPQSKITRVYQPDLTYTDYEFGVLHGFNDGRLLKTAVKAQSGVALREEQNIYYSDADYAAASPKPFPDVVGINTGAADAVATRVRPIKKTVITQQSAIFTNEINTFDAYARPTSVSKTSSGLSGSPTSYTRNESRAYHNNLALWVVGQLRYVATGTVPVDCTQEPKTTPECTKYHDDVATGAWALPIERYAFGKLMQRTVYHTTGVQAGLPHQIYDGSNVKKTTLTDYHRGIPRNVLFHDNHDQEALVNDHGEITRITNELNEHTSFGRDGFGRLTSITYPLLDTTTWEVKSFDFRPLTLLTEKYGIGQGHWLHRTAHGNYRKDVYLNALWRPVLTHEYDSTNEAGTSRFTRRIFDPAGRESFVSYAEGTIVDYKSPVEGLRHYFDALGRPTSSVQTSELGDLTTSTFYEPGFITRIRNPREFDTHYRFQAFDRPDDASPVRISQPEGITTNIVRDVFGKPDSLTRSGPFGAGTLTHTRRYVYDSHQRLCKRVDPETDATHFVYDDSGNLRWDLSGSTSTALSCDVFDPMNLPTTGNLRTYDARNRLTNIDYPGSTVDLSFQYEPDGLLFKALTTQWNPSDPASTNVWTYTYNKRRLLLSEQSQMGAGKGKLYGYQYNSLGHLQQLTYPAGSNVTLGYAPNVFGQPTQAGAYATNVQYFPNGAVKQFTYGNLITRVNDQNTRRLIDSSFDAFGANIYHNFTYGYDPNGNVVGIGDAEFDLNSRSMTYDDADRLESAWSPNSMISASYTYDPLDNLRTATVGGQATTYGYHPTKHRLSSLVTSSGSTILGYDVRGNQTTKGAQGYTFDAANRLTAVPGIVSLYSYDAHGRRAGEIDTGGPMYSVYTLDGVMRSQFDGSTHTSYIHLGKQLVATRKNPGGTTYHHTDALGTPVLETNASRGTVTTTTVYSPYGKAENRTVDGPGYTGHMADGPTGLVYMQQRYYDPGTGRFLSIDPVEVGAVSGENFNRYWYANNNPYTMVDPNGMSAIDRNDLPGLQSEPRTLDTIHVTAPRPAGGIPIGSGNSREMRQPSFFKLTTFQAARRDVSVDEAVRDGELTRTVTLPAIVVAASPVPAALIGISGVPIAMEAPAAALLLVQNRTTRELVYAACIVVGACQGTKPSLARVNQQDRIQQVREGNVRESRRFQRELPKQ